MTDKEKSQSNTPENEVRVSGRTNVLGAVDRIVKVFEKFDHVVLSGINTGISKVLLITEIIKLKVPDLHQYNLIETITREMHEEDKKEESQENPRYLTRFKVELYKTKLASEPKGAFYEAPYTAEQVKKISEVKAPERSENDRPHTARGGRGRGRGGFRGGRGEGRGGRGEGRGRGRGRGGPRSARGGKDRNDRGERGERGERRGGRGEGRGRGGPRGGNRGGPRGRGRGGKERGGKQTEEGH